MSARSGRSSAGGGRATGGLWGACARRSCRGSRGRACRFDLPGLAIGIVADDRLVYAKGFGVRRKGGEPVDTETVFQIGSTTKATRPLERSILFRVCST